MENITQIEYLFPKTVDWTTWLQQKADVPFSESVIEFLNALSQSLLHDPSSRAFSDVVTFAFFCRRANMQKQKERYTTGQVVLGKGLIFHIAPSNVPINFAYSLVAGLVAGNYNIVRVSSKTFPQVDIVIRHIAALADTYPEVAQRIILVRYDHESNANKVFSAACQMRVVWGGDRTIATLRENALAPRATEICFADRYSLAVIQADKLVGETNMPALAEKFYNDTYLFDQNACTAPHLIVWLGQAAHIAKGKELFWSTVHQYVIDHYRNMQDVMAVDKLTAMCRQAIKTDIRCEQTADNYLNRVELNTLNKDIEDYRCLGGYFAEYTASALSEIAPIVNSKYQTLSYYGLEQEELKQFVQEQRLSGIDRIVPIGETTTFSFTWDGYNLIQQMSRIIDINNKDTKYSK